jgi:hypothetical protein
MIYCLDTEFIIVSFGFLVDYIVRSVDRVTSVYF